MAKLIWRHLISSCVLRRWSDSLLFGPGSFKHPDTDVTGEALFGALRETSVVKPPD